MAFFFKTIPKIYNLHIYLKWKKIGKKCKEYVVFLSLKLVDMQSIRCWWLDIYLCVSTNYRSTCSHIYVLAPPAEWQRRFSNAESSVVCRLLSSTFHLNGWFLKNGLINFFLFWHGASLGRYYKNMDFFLLGGNFLKNCSITFSLFMQEASQGGYYSTFKGWIRLNRSKGHFSRSKRSDKGQIWLFLLLFDNFL